jgi:DnaJ-class molecular chaperone
MNQKDYYEILGLEKEVSPQKIKEAYRKLAFQFHPDRNRENVSAAEKMKEINEAYAVLSDPKKKNDYDTCFERYGPFAYDRFKQRYSEQDIFRGSDIYQVFEEMAKTFGLGSFEEVFRGAYGQGDRTFEFQRPGVSGRGFVFLGPGFGRVKGQGTPGSSEIFSGTLGKIFQYLLKKTLGIREPDRGKDLEDVIYLTPQQALEGGKGKYLHRRRSKQLIITIPPEIKEGQRIRLKRMGVLGKEGGAPGDLYLKVKIKKPFIEKVKELLKK